MSVRKLGDWRKARALLTGATNRYERALAVALKREAIMLRSEVVKGITRQAPGGGTMKPPGKLTLAARRMKGSSKSKSLIVGGDLVGSISSRVRKRSAVVGVRRSAKTQDGKDMVNLAKVHEFGSKPRVIPVTPRMRGFLAALFREAGFGGGVPAVIVVSTPPRPFMRPAWEKYRKSGVLERFEETVKTVLLGERL